MSTGAREQHKSSDLDGNNSAGEGTGACDLDGTSSGQRRPQLPTSSWLCHMGTLQKWPHTPYWIYSPSVMGLCNPLHQEVESISPALETAGHETCSGQWETGRCDASGGMKLGHWSVLSRCSWGPSGPGGKGPGQLAAWRIWPSCVIAAGPRPPSPR